MSLRIDYQIIDDLGMFNLYGEMSSTGAKKLWETIYNVIINNKPCGIVLFDDSKKIVNYFNIAEIVFWLSSVRFPKSCRIAIVDPNPTEGHNRFLQDAAINKGWSNIRVFEDGNTAIDWVESPNF
jgi:hypothetical protein